MKKKFKMFVSSSAFILILTDVFRSYIFLNNKFACFFLSSYKVSLNSANLSLLSM